MAQLAATLLVMGLAACDPDSCGFMYDAERRPHYVAGVIVGLVPPLGGILFPLTILGTSIWGKAGWAKGLSLTALSLLLSFVMMRVWVFEWS